MLKNLALKKTIIISISFLILLIIYFFPTDDTYQINTTLTYTDPVTIPIYLIDQNNLVSRFEVIKKSDNINTLIEEVITNLTINSNSNIPSNFKQVIPEGTKIINKDLTDGLLKINFSKELLNVSLDDEEAMLEALIYSLTEIKDVKKIMIFVEGELLKSLPKSGKALPNTLDKSYGINKVYELDSMKDVTKITTYYVSKTDGLSYYTPLTTVTNSKNEKVEIIIEKLKTSPTYDTNLISYLATSTELLNYEILENSINLSFNNQILNLDDNKIIEEVKYAIALSIRDTYSINETIFYVDDMLIDAFFI